MNALRNRKVVDVFYAPVPPSLKEMAAAHASRAANCGPEINVAQVAAHYQRVEHQADINWVIKSIKHHIRRGDYFAGAQ